MVLLFWYCLLLFHTVKCTLTELTTKSFSTLWKSMVFVYAHAREFYVLFVWEFLACALSANFQYCLEWQLIIIQAVFSTPSLPFSTVYSVWQVSVSLSCVGAHDCIARIYQPWEQSPFRSRLPIVEAPCGSLLHVLEFTKYVFNKL